MGRILLTANFKPRAPPDAKALKEHACKRPFVRYLHTRQQNEEKEKRQWC